MLHSQIYDMVQHGNSFTFMDVYKMPTYLRNFYYNKLVETKKTEQKTVQELETKQKQGKVRMR
jgi:hypothetical protein